MHSHAQNGEDVVLNRAFAEQATGYYIDIGACHPVEDSVTLHFYKQGWRGANVEPDRALFEEFQRSRERDINVCSAVASTRGRTSFYPTGTRGHGTLSADLASHRIEGRSPERVATVPLSDVFDCYGPESGDVDFLKIDVEGWEADVIASGDWQRHRPRVVLIEAVDDSGHSTHEGWEPALLASGYQFGMFDGLNRFYCRDEDAGLLLDRLRTPANVRDGWMRASEARGHEAAARLAAELSGSEQRVEEEQARALALRSELAEARAALDAAVEDREAALKALDGANLEARKALDGAALDLERAEAAAERLGVELARACGEAAAAYRREEAAEAAMASLEMDLLRRDSEIAVLASRLDALIIGEQALLNAQEQSALAAAESEAWLQAVRSSTSWRLTRPFRVGGRLILSRRRGR